MTYTLVTGTGRSGTTSAFNILTQLGLSCGVQERQPGEDAAVSALGFVANFSGWGNVIAQVREPLACIRSLHTTKNPLRLETVTTETGNGSRLHNAMLYYYYANVWIQDHLRPALTYRTDDLAIAVARSFALDLESCQSVVAAHSRDNSRDHSLRYPHDLTWGDLQNEDREIASRCQEFWQSIPRLSS